MSTMLTKCLPCLTDGKTRQDKTTPLILYQIDRSPASALSFFKAFLLYASKTASWLNSALTYVLLLWLFLSSSLAHGKNVVKRYRQSWFGLPLLWVAFLPYVQAEGIITTVAGNGTAGYSGDGGPVVNAQLSNPGKLRFDRNGNLYIADSGNQRVRKIDTTGIISTIAGNGIKGYSGDNGLATVAQLDSPNGVAVDTVGNIYMSEWSRVRKVDTHGLRKVTFSDKESSQNRYNLIADYRFDGNAEDMTGNNPPMTLKNTQFVDNTLYLNGRYEYSSSFDDGYVATAKIGNLSYNHFSLSLDFYSLGQTPENLQQKPEGKQVNIITGGTSYRWFGLRYSNVTTSNSQLELTLNNGNYVHSFKQVPFEPNKWHTVIVSVDLENKKILTLFDGNKLDDIILDAGFLLSVIGSSREESDKVFTFANYSNAAVFYGYVDNLKVFGQALSISEMQALGQKNIPPVADYSASPTSGQAPLTATLDASLSSDPDGSIVNYQWLVNGQTLTGKTVSVTLEKAEDYPITLTVTDDKGAISTKTGKITVSQPVATNQSPKADYNASPNSGQAPLTVTLDASSSSCGSLLELGFITGVQWSVNGQTLTGTTTTVTLEKAGDYPITLTVTCYNGATLTKTGTIAVTEKTAQPQSTNLPSLGDNFTGGIAVNGQSSQRQALLTLNNPVEVTGNITVDPAHVGKTADIFVYVEATLPPAKEAVSLMLGEGLKSIPVWDQNPANLIPFQPNVTL